MNLVGVFEVVAEIEGRRDHGRNVRPQKLLPVQPASVTKLLWLKVA